MWGRQLLPLEALFSTAITAAGLLTGNPVRETASQWERCYLNELGSCLAPPKGDFRATKHNPRRCLNVDKVHCDLEHGAWLGPAVPASWHRMATKSPCYKEEGSGNVHCLPLLLNLAPPKCGTSDLYDRLMAHPAIIRGDRIEKLFAIDTTGGDSGNVVKEPKFWENGPPRNATLDIYAAEFAPLSLMVQGKQAYQPVRMAQQTAGQAFIYEPEEHTRAVAARALAGNTQAQVSGLAARAFSVDFSATTFDTSPVLISQVMPEARFVAFLRDPVQRAESHYNYAYNLVNGKYCKQLGGPPYSPAALDANVRNITATWAACSRVHRDTECWRLLNKRRSMSCGAYAMSGKFVLNGLYSVYLSWFQEYFPKRRFFIRKLEDMDFIQNQAAATEQVKELLDFMDVGDIPLVERRANIAFGAVRHHVNSTRPDYVKMRSDTRILLQTFYDPYVRKLQDTFENPGLSWW